MSDCDGKKAQRLHDFLYELYSSVPDFVGHLLAYVFTNWQQNGLIPRLVSKGVRTPFGLDCSSKVSAYADDITIIVSKMVHLQRVVKTLHCLIS